VSQVLPPTPWLACPRPKPRAALRLFCFPHAGGGTVGYRRWAEVLPEAVEVCLVQLPGRESRFREPPFLSMTALVGALADALPLQQGRPFAFYGHSMGTLVAFDLARELRRQSRPGPAHLFVSGRGAPPVRSASPPLHGLPDPEFLQELRRMGGTPREVLDNAELMRVFLPVLRADFTLAETYACDPEPPLDCPISAFAGTDDRAWPRAGLEAWREQTRSAFHLRMYPGGHFFIRSDEGPFLAALSEDLAVLARRLAGASPADPCRWEEPARASGLGADEVHVWRVPLDCGPDAVARLLESLADDERERADRFHFDKDRRHFIAGRGCLRAVLGRYLGEAPGRLSFTYNFYGKPTLASATDLRFNLTHSHGLALVAVTRGREVGVDVEYVRRDLAGELLAERFFSPREAAALRALPEPQRREAFFRCWTRKEAYIKARGAGLSLPLDRFDVTLRPDEPAMLLATHDEPDEARRWTLRALTPGEGYVGALAAEGDSWRLWCGHWPADEMR
jgi:medium-chain acyl-[acyl-carrier-protein] hydrolase